MDMNGSVRISGIGFELPEQIVHSDDLLHEVESKRRFNIPENFISSRIGIETRRVVDKNTKPSDLASPASLAAIKDAGIDPLDIELIIFCGIEADYCEPATSHQIQQAVGAINAACYDTSNASHGMIDALMQVDTYVQCGAIENALVCTAEVPSKRMFNFMDQLSTIKDKDQFKKWLGFFTLGDGGGAFIVSRAVDDSGIKKYRTRSNGSYWPLCYYGYDIDKGYVGCMEMSAINKELMKYYSTEITKTYSQLGWSAADIDLLFSHQVGSLLHNNLLKLLDISADKAPVSYRQFGNLTTVTLPALFNLSRPEKGDKLLVLSAGSGITVSQTEIIF